MLAGTCNSTTHRRNGAFMYCKSILELGLNPDDISIDEAVEYILFNNVSSTDPDDENELHENHEELISAVSVSCM